MPKKNNKNACMVENSMFTFAMCVWKLSVESEFVNWLFTGFCFGETPSQIFVRKR